MRTLSRSWILLVLGASLCAHPLSAQTNPPTYVVIPPGKGQDFLMRLDQLSDQGYRVIVGGKYLILHLEATPPDTYRYVRLEINGGVAQFTNWINDQGAHGYRWLPGTGLLEKAHHPHNYRYTNAPHGGASPASSRELSFLADEGYRPTERVYFSHSIGASTTEIFFERELGQPYQPAFFPYRNEIQLADAMRTSNVMKRVDELARQGYRFLGRHDSKKGAGMAVMMVSCGKDCAAHYEYRHFDAKNSQQQIEHDLNQLGQDGFQVLPSALSWPPHLLERDATAKRTFAYRAADASHPIHLEQFLNTVDHEGYAPLGFVWRIGWTADAYFVAEKETTSPLP